MRFLIQSNINRPTAVLSKSASPNEDVEEGLNKERIRYEQGEEIRNKNKSNPFFKKHLNKTVILTI